MGKPDGPGTCPTARLLGRGPPNAKHHTTPRTPPNRAGCLGSGGPWFWAGKASGLGWFWSFAALGFFRSALEFVSQRFGVWSVSQLFGKGCFLLAGSGLEVNWFGVGQGGVKCANFNGLAGLLHVWSCSAWLGALELFSCGPPGKPRLLGGALGVGHAGPCARRLARRRKRPPDTRRSSPLPKTSRPTLRPHCARRPRSCARRCARRVIPCPTLRPTHDPLPDAAPDAQNPDAQNPA